MGERRWASALERDYELLWGEVKSPLSLPLNASSGAYVSTLLVKSGQGKLYGFSGYNSKSSSQYVQVFDTNAAPQSGDAPKVVINVLPTSNFSIDYTDMGRHFRIGIYLANSSTGPTYTAGSADCWFDAQYV